MQIQSSTFSTRKTTTLPYKLYLPDDYEAQPERQWPLILFLHGAGERGIDLKALTNHGLPKKIEAGDDLPFVVIAPQCPPEQWWLSFAPILIDLVEQITKQYHIDKRRRYLTGLSMGGHGVWDIATQYPRTFAAIAPICGGGRSLFGYPERVRRITHLPVWAFHGDADDVVPLSLQAPLVEALKAAGGNVTFTVYEGVDHDSWTQTYDNPALYEWFLQHEVTET